MYKNIGRKIQILAYIFVWLGILFSIGGGFYLFYIRPTTILGIPTIYISAGVIIVGSLLSLFASWFIFAFGQLVADMRAISSKLPEIRQPEDFLG